MPPFREEIPKAPNRKGGANIPYMIDSAGDLELVAARRTAVLKLAYSLLFA